mgnify:CR=1
MDYFNEYSSHEIECFRKYVNDNAWISGYVKEIIQDNTPLHDILVITNKGKKFTVEIKEDENYWFSKTGNIGLDYISSFEFLNFKDKFLYKNLWVPVENITEFEKQINVSKYGKLITCDADFQFYFVLNDNKNDFAFAKLYDNKMLKSIQFVDYLKQNYRLRINDKKSYGLNDSWESAAFFVNPLEDKKLKECEINSFEDFAN